MSSEATEVTPKVVTGAAFLEALRDAGFVLPAKVHRATITAGVQEPLRIQFDCFGDERLLALANDLTEGEIA